MNRKYRLITNPTTFELELQHITRDGYLITIKGDMLPHIGNTPHPNPEVGSIWFNSKNGSIYRFDGQDWVCYDDDNGVPIDRIPPIDNHVENYNRAMKGLL